MALNVWESFKALFKAKERKKKATKAYDPAAELNKGLGRSKSKAREMKILAEELFGETKKKEKETKKTEDTDIED